MTLRPELKVLVGLSLRVAIVMLFDQGVFPVNAQLENFALIIEVVIFHFLYVKLWLRRDFCCCYCDYRLWQLVSNCPSLVFDSNGIEVVPGSVPLVCD